ncbi:MAG: DUF3048 domain-containing protein [Anaerolineaceae bacterium]|nr:DUF3048 domain-containing protein [Anaerolineaceae bacterium]
MKRNTLFQSISLFLLMLLLSACSMQTKALSTPISTATKTKAVPTKTASITSTVTSQYTATASPTATATPVVAGPEEYSDGMNPLTGLFVDDPEILSRRPVLIKVSNFPREGRPHAGLSNADIVFDYYIGEGTNRFIALFYGEESEKVGPIRSGRLVDGQIVRLYNGILGYASADQYNVNPTILQKLGSRAISFTPSKCPALCDDGANNVFSVSANTSEMTKYYNNMAGITTFDPQLGGMYFESEAPQNNNPADTITIKYNAFNIGEWQYDELEGNYLRWIEEVDQDNNLNMIPLLDRNNDELINAENVIILFANYIHYNATLQDIELWYNYDGRRAVLFRDGIAQEGIWKYIGPDQPLQFFTETGGPMALKPGNTWITIGGLSSSLETPESGRWTFQFYLP